MANNTEDAELTKVCSHCGGKLTKKKITENSCFTDHKEVITEHQVCEACSRIEYGVDPKQFEMARKLVKELDYKPYSHLNRVDDGEEYFINSQTGGAYDMVRFIQQEANRQKVELLDELESKAQTPPGYVEVKVVHLSVIEAERKQLEEQTSGK